MSHNDATASSLGSDAAQPRVGELWLHPVKSCAAQAVRVMELVETGPVGDRAWMWIDDASGRFVSQRTHPALATVTAREVGGRLELSVDGGPPLVVDPPAIDAPLRAVEVWGDACTAVDAGDVPARWIGDRLGVTARLVLQRGPRVRRPKPHLDAAQAGAVASPPRHVSFADGYPVLVATSAAVEQITRRAARSADARRFRPNIVVAGAPAFAEDGWARVALGSAVLRLVKPCGRCGVLDVDPTTGARDPGLLAALRPDRARGGELVFGMNALVETPGVVRVGDAVRVLSSGAGR